jgi:DNA-directed RNA polymerase specialized sigma24 family protein
VIGGEAMDEEQFIDSAVSRAIRRYKNTAWWSEREELGQQLRVELLASIRAVGLPRTKELASVIAHRSLARHIRKFRLPVSGDVWREQRTAHISRAGDEVLDTTVSHFENPEAHAISSERTRIVRAYVGLVYTDSKDIDICLMWADDVPLFEIARRMGCSIGTVGNRIRRLRQVLVRSRLRELWLD